MGQALNSDRVEASPYRTTLLSSEEFDHFWPAIAHELDTVPHIWQDYWTKEALREWTLVGRLQCWGTGLEGEMRLVCFSQIALYPRGRVLQVFLAFGNDVAGCLPSLFAAFENFASQQDCYLADVTGRPGWEVELRKYGFKRTTSTLVRQVQRISVN